MLVNLSPSPFELKTGDVLRGLDISPEFCVILIGVEQVKKLEAVVKVLNKEGKAGALVLPNAKFGEKGPVGNELLYTTIHSLIKSFNLVAICPWLPPQLADEFELHSL